MSSKKRSGEIIEPLRHLENLEKNDYTTKAPKEKEYKQLEHLEHLEEQVLLFRERKEILTLSNAKKNKGRKEERVLLFRERIKTLRPLRRTCFIV